MSQAPSTSVINSKLAQAKGALENLAHSRATLADLINPILTPDEPKACDPAGDPSLVSSPNQSSVADHLDQIIALIEEERFIIQSLARRVES